MFRYVSHMRKMLPLTSMSTNLEGLEVEFLARAFLYFHTLCIRAAKALASLRICTDSSEPSLLTDAISTEIICTGSYMHMYDYSV